MTATPKTEDGEPQASDNGHQRRRWVASDGSYPLHPFLFAGASVLAVLANGLTQATFPDVVPALFTVLIFASLITFAVAALRRRFDARTAVIASIWIIGCLFYVSLFTDLNRLMDGGFPMLPTLPVAMVALIVLTVAALRVPPALASAANLVMNCIAVVMVVTPVWYIAAYEWHNAAARSVYDAGRAAADLPQVQPTSVTPDGKRPPDIYHLVFDRYGNEETLSRHYDVDNRAIGQFLEAHGFYVARSSNSNYLKTGHSLASTFYMDYLDLLADPRVGPKNWHPVHAMLRDTRVGRFLKARGYRTIQFGSWWVGTYKSHATDENHPHGFSEFNLNYSQRTILRPLLHLLPDNRLATGMNWDKGQCQRVARQIEEIKAIGGRETPVYVFAHILVPHDPYVFAADGRCLSQEESRARGNKRGYTDQVAYANRIIEDLVTGLQAKDRAPPVILIQADEGPFPKRDYSVPWQDAPAEELRVKTGILNAYYFPGHDYSALSDDITPVNSYRIVFNTYFGTEFPILTDRIFAFPTDAKLFEFHDVTAKVRGESQNALRPTGSMP